MKVWVLFSEANDYNQPDKAFQHLYWDKPTKEEEEQVKRMNDNENGDSYWIEEFKK